MNAKYYFWLVIFKLWCLESLQKKKRPISLPKLEYCIKKIERFNIQFDPTTYIDSEEFLEKLQKYAVVFKKVERLKFKKSIKSSKLSRKCSRV